MCDCLNIVARKVNPKVIACLMNSAAETPSSDNQNDPTVALTAEYNTEKIIPRKIVYSTIEQTTDPGFHPIAETTTNKMELIFEIKNDSKTDSGH